MDEVSLASERLEPVDGEYHLFANLLKLALVRNFNGCKSEAASRVTDFCLAVQKKYVNQPSTNSDYYQHRLDYYSFLEILKGKLKGGKHPLSVSRLKDFLIFFIGQKGFDTYARIYNLLSAGTPEIKNLLVDQEIILKIKEKGILPHPLWDSFTPGFDDHTITRQNLGALIELVQKRKSNFLVGDPGVGKSMVVRLIAHDSRLYKFDHIFWIDAATENSILGSLLRIVNCYQNRNIVIEESISKLFAMLEDFSIHDNVLLLVENVRLKKILHSIRDCIPPSWHYLCEISSQEMLASGEIPLDNAIHIEEFNQVELEAFWKYFARRRNLRREIFDELCHLTKCNPFNLYIGVCYADTFGEDIARKEFAESPHKSIIELILDRLDDRKRECVLKMGVLPNLWSYTILDFCALWMTTEHDAHENLTIFSRLGLVKKHEIVSGSWKVFPSVIKYANLKITKMMRTSAQGWIMRRDIKSINCQLIKDFLKDRPELTETPKLPNNVFIRVFNQLLDPQRHNSANQLFEGSTMFLTSQEFLAQQYELKLDIILFNIARALVLFLIILLGTPYEWMGMSLKDFCYTIAGFFIAWGIIVYAIKFLPFFRERDFIIFAIWREAQKRKVEKVP